MAAPDCTAVAARSGRVSARMVATMYSAGPRTNDRYALADVNASSMKIARMSVLMSYLLLRNCVATLLTSAVDGSGVQNCTSALRAMYGAQVGWDRMMSSASAGSIVL